MATLSGAIEEEFIHEGHEVHEGIQAMYLLRGLRELRG
jgi:hypothetical protein